MKKIFMLGFLWANLLFCCPEEKLYKTHTALFEAFLPSELKNPNQTEKTLLDEAKEEIWQKILQNNELKLLIGLYCDTTKLTSPILESLYNTFLLQDCTQKDLDLCHNKKVVNYLKSINSYCCTKGIYDLTEDQIINTINLLIKNKSLYFRRLGFTARMFYISQIYSGALGDYASGIKRNIKSLPDQIPRLNAMTTHLTYNEHKGKIEGELDYLIIGSGASASVIAYNLTKANKKVLMLDKGAFAIPGSMETMSNFHFFNEGGLKPDMSGNVFFFISEAFGGGPVPNMNIFIPNKEPFVENMWKTWYENGILPQSWSYENLINASEKIEEILDPREVTLDDVDSNNQYLAKGALNLGYSYKLHKLTTYHEQDSPYEVTLKKSSLERFIIPSFYMETPLNILPNCEVTKIIIKNGKASGVYAKIKKPWIQRGVVNDPYNWNIPDGKKIKIKAKKIILAAGTLGSTTILLKTKEIHNKNIGKGIIAHPAIPIMAIYENALKAHGTVSGVYIDEFIDKSKDDNKLNFLIETSQGTSSLGAVLTPGNPDTVLDIVENLPFTGGAAVVLFDTVNTKNKIKLDAFKKPQIYYSLSEVDKNRIVLAICELIKILLASGAQKVILSSYEDIPNEITNESQIDIIRENLKLTSNQIFVMSGHLMGANKLNKVINENLQIISNKESIENLYLCDSSILPESPHVNPMPLIYGFAQLFSQSLLK